jgi:hypothetical protein
MTRDYVKQTGKVFSALAARQNLTDIGKSLLGSIIPRHTFPINGTFFSKIVPRALRLQTYASVCKRMQAYASVCKRNLLDKALCYRRNLPNQPILAAITAKTTKATGESAIANRTTSSPSVFNPSGNPTSSRLNVG